jgi:hypothetical protein
MSIDTLASSFSITVASLLFARPAALTKFQHAGASVVNICSGAGELTPPTSAVFGTERSVSSITRVVPKKLGQSTSV